MQDCHQGTGLQLKPCTIGALRFLTQANQLIIKHFLQFDYSLLLALIQVIICKKYLTLHKK